MKKTFVNWALMTVLLIIIFIILNLFGFILLLFAEGGNEYSIWDYLIAPLYTNIIVLSFYFFNRKYTYLYISLFALLSAAQYFLFQSMSGADFIWEDFKLGNHFGYSIYYFIYRYHIVPQDLFVSLYSFLQLIMAFLTSRFIVNEILAKNKIVSG